MSDTDPDDMTAPEDRENDPLAVPTNRDISAASDTAFTLLQAQQRRAILSYFMERSEETATIPELVTHCEQASTNATRDSDRIPAQLHHQHLPKLADAGILEYDARTKTIRYRGDQLLESLLNFIREHHQQNPNCR